MLYFTHRAAHDSEKISVGLRLLVKHFSEQMLDKLKTKYIIVFNEPVYPIWGHRQQFQIPLIDTSK